ncbi:MAG: 3-hydroxyacyl-CoA dehydrogenase family protein [Acidobacteriota bacterium]
MSEHTFGAAAVIGTGMMGPGIAVTLALGGLRTTILSRTEGGAAQGLEKARAQIKLLEENGLARPGHTGHELAAGTDFEAAIAAADLVIESAPENMEFKQELFARLDSLAKPGAVLASNTSGLSITEIASRCGRPERVLTTHFWNPPHLMPLVEIVKGARTSDAVAAAVRQLLLDCGKVPVVVKKDRPGQLGNRLQHALWREALYIVQEGIADPEEVDLAAKTGFGLRLPVYGIFEHMDAVGLELAYAVTDYVARDLYSERKAPDIMPEMIRRGHLGARAGRGFYDWSKRDFRAVIERRDRFVLEFLRSKFSGPLS